MGRKALILLIILFGCKKGTSDEQIDFVNPVLVEQFTNYNCIPCKGANEIVDSLQILYPDKVFTIRYHVNFPYPNDPLYTPYSDSAVSYYNLNLSQGVPITIILGSYIEIGYDDALRSDYIQRWFNKMKELSKNSPFYNASGIIEYFGNSVNVNISLDKNLSSNHKANIYITEYNVQLPSGSAKPYSNFALRKAFNGLNASFEIDTSWKIQDLHTVFVVRDENRNILSLWQGKVSSGFEVLSYKLQSDSIVSILLNETFKFYLKLKNNTNQTQKIIIDVSGLPRDWIPTLCFKGVCRNTTNVIDSLLPGYETGDGSFYFGAIATTNESAIIDMKVSIENKNLYKTIRGRVNVQ